LSKKSKCSEVNGISPEILHLAQDVLAVPLTLIINTSIQEGIVPDCWKVAKCMPLHKKKEKTSASNYCPVSILPSPSKILKEVVRKQLVSPLDKHGIIPNSQYGFRAGRSTSAALGAAHFD
jgi:hypothetical protein